MKGNDYMEDRVHLVLMLNHYTQSLDTICLIILS